MPPADGGWTWDEFQANAQKLTKPGQYGVGLGPEVADQPVLNLALNFDGKFFYADGGKTEVKVGDAEKEVPKRIHDMIYTTSRRPRRRSGMSGADILPGFFGGKYAMIPAATSLRQQMVEQAPAGFEWVTLPPIKGSLHQAGRQPADAVDRRGAQAQEAGRAVPGVLPEPDQHGRPRQGRLAGADRQAGRRELVKPTGGKQGWDVAADSGADLTVAPFQKVDGYPEWKTKYATPALQQYFANKITLDQLGTSWSTVGSRF